MKVLKKITALAMAAVTAGAMRLNAFAGGPRPQEDELAAEEAESTEIAEASVQLTGLTVGGVYNIRPMGSSGISVYAITIENDEKTISLTPRSSLKFEQAFQLIASGSGYKFKALCSPNGKVLDVWRKSNGNLENGCTVDIDGTNDSAAQEFVIDGDASSSCVIRLANSNYNNLVLASVGTSVQLQTYNAAANNQKWKFVERTNTYTKDPDPDAQNKKNWCWSAAAKRIVNQSWLGLKNNISTSPKALTDIGGLHKPYYGYSISGTESHYFVDGVQYAIVKECHDNDADATGGPTEIKKGIKLAAAKDVDPEWSGNTGDLTDDDINNINEELAERRYVIGFVNGTGGGHFVVLEKYDDATDTYTVFNPWNNTEKTINGDMLFGNSEDGKKDNKYVYLDVSIGRMYGYYSCRLAS